jgi:hypothetical protein
VIDIYYSKYGKNICKGERSSPISYKKWNFLITEARGVYLDDTSSKSYIYAFMKDLEKAIALDNFRFSKKHALNCVADLTEMFEDNYTPTFNIELLR